MSLFTCECEFCGNRRLKLFSKAYPSIWSMWKVYRFCNRECAKKFIERSREEELKYWRTLCDTFQRKY